MSDEQDYSKLTGDQLTWALHRENRSRWRELKDQQKIVLAILVVLLGSQLTGFHVVPDPTLHLHLFGLP